MVSSKPEGFKEAGAGERLQTWPVTELAEQFQQEWEGQAQGSSISRLALLYGRAREPHCPATMRRGQFLHLATE